MMLGNLPRLARWLGLPLFPLLAVPLPLPVKYRLYFGEPMRFTGSPEKVVNLFSFIAEEVREILASLGTTAERRDLGRVLDLLALMRFASRRPDRRERTLLRWCDSRLWRKRAAFQGLRKGTLVHAAMQPSALWDVLGYPGPIGPRPDAPRKTIEPLRVGDRDLLFMDRSTLADPGKSVRGGIPVCWPWFGDLKRNPQAVQAMHQGGPLTPAHGLVRALDWELQKVDSQAQEVHLSLRCTAAEQGLPLGLMSPTEELMHQPHRRGMVCAEGGGMQHLRE